MLNQTQLTRRHHGRADASWRSSDNYKLEYQGSLVDRWDEWVDWERRARGEGDFFNNLLAHHGVNRVLDVAAGTGFHSVHLLENGYEVLAADGSAEMLARAEVNARRRGLELETARVDWRWLTVNESSQCRVQHFRPSLDDNDGSRNSSHRDLRTRLMVTLDNKTNDHRTTCGLCGGDTLGHVWSLTSGRWAFCPTCRSSWECPVSRS